MNESVDNKIEAGNLKIMSFLRIDFLCHPKSIQELEQQGRQKSLSFYLKNVFNFLNWRGYTGEFFRVFE